MILKLIDHDTVRVLDEKFKAKQKRDYDSHHGARSLLPLNSGDEVWIPDHQGEASIAQEVGIKWLPQRGHTAEIGETSSVSQAHPVQQSHLQDHLHKSPGQPSECQEL